MQLANVPGSVAMQLNAPGGRGSRVSLSDPHFFRTLFNCKRDWLQANAVDALSRCIRGARILAWYSRNGQPSSLNSVIDVAVWCAIVQKSAVNNALLSKRKTQLHPFATMSCPSRVVTGPLGLLNWVNLELIASTNLLPNRIFENVPSKKIFKKCVLYLKSWSRLHRESYWITHFQRCCYFCKPTFVC